MNATIEILEDVVVEYGTVLFRKGTTLFATLRKNGNASVRIPFGGCGLTLVPSQFAVKAEVK